MLNFFFRRTRENPGQKAPISVPAPTALAPAESVVTAPAPTEPVVAAPILMTEDPQKTKTKVKMESFEADAYNHPLAEEYIPPPSEKSMLLGERVEDMPEQEVIESHRATFSGVFDDEDVHPVRENPQPPASAHGLVALLEHHSFVLDDRDDIGASQGGAVASAALVNNEYMKATATVELNQTETTMADQVDAANSGMSCSDSEALFKLARQFEGLTGAANWSKVRMYHLDSSNSAVHRWHPPHFPLPPPHLTLFYALLLYFCSDSTTLRDACLVLCCC